ncbi:hypothetical protein PLICRDRAFT_40006 [Plicaturopsis crispa FD-325 SS-3]|nr:hypothetical protein PLICRDRAFT_40006 [Plicaturopsis crispa FD-325 SS-3]
MDTSTTYIPLRHERETPLSPRNCIPKTTPVSAALSSHSASLRAIALSILLYYLLGDMSTIDGFCALLITGMLFLFLAQVDPSEPLDNSANALAPAVLHLVRGSVGIHCRHHATIRTEVGGQHH